MKKALKAANKALDKAKALEADAAATKDPDKKAKDMDRLSDQYNTALDAFTEALSHKSDLVEAWDQVGYIHLRLGAFREAIDDYNHTLALKPELMEAIEHRAEAYLAVDHLDEVKIAYMDLYNHSPDLAAQLMAAMQKWVAARQADSSGIAQRRCRGVRQMGERARRHRQADRVAPALMRRAFQLLDLAAQRLRPSPRAA